MRRADRQVQETSEIHAIIESCRTCHLAMIDGQGEPYVLPLSFGYTLQDDALTLYFHSAKAGRKLDVLRQNPRVGFALSCEGEAAFPEGNPCNSGYYFSSVVGTGNARFLSDPAEKCRALSLLMERQTGRSVPFSAAQADTVCVFSVSSCDFTGKRKPRP